MTTSFLPTEKCVILSVLHQQSNTLKEWHQINIHRKLVVEKESRILPIFCLVSCLLIFMYFTTQNLQKKTREEKICLQICLLFGSKLSSILSFFLMSQRK